MDDRREILTAALERALTDELATEWRRQNEILFRRQLKPCVLGLRDGGGKLGEWDLSARSITFARDFAVTQPWAKVVEVLKHEMAHQYAHEVLGAVFEPAHGPAFRRACEERGIDPAAAGLPQGDDDSDTRVLRKVTRLLALAQSSNRHEAESAMAHAQRLMLLHELDVEKLHRARGYAFVQLGVPRSRVQRHEKILAHILVTHFFVQAILVPAFRAADGARGFVLELSGARANLEMATYVHAFLLRACDALWDEHKRARGLSDKDRLRFYAGVMRGFEEKLAGAKKIHTEEGLVWRGDAQLDAWFHRRHPSIRRTRVDAAGGDAHESGRKAGRDLVLHKPIDDGAVARGRQLNPGSSRGGGG